MRMMSNLTNTVIEKSCHRTLIGKPYWKSVVLPNLLYGVEAMEMRESDIDKLQKSENSAMRRILIAEGTEGRSV